MALTPFQRTVCRLLADRRLASGERYVAGGLALNTLLRGARVSRDVDLFHDTDAALAASVEADTAALAQAGLDVEPVRRLVGFVEVVVRAPDGEALDIQWARDSAFRFFPLVEHADLGLTLHPFDLATNKVLALVGRVEARDWIDTLTCDAHVSPLGCLAWAASGKDPGLNPRFIVDEAARTARYSTVELSALQFDGVPPDPATLGARWRAILAEAHAMIDALPPARVGNAVLTADGEPFRGDARALAAAADAGTLRFHPGAIGGAWPEVRVVAGS